MDTICEVKSIECVHVKVGDHVMIKGRPCRVIETKHAKAGKHGGMKARIVGRDLISEIKHEFMDSGHRPIPTFDPIRKQELFVGFEGSDELLQVFTLDAKKQQVKFKPFNLAETQQMVEEGYNDDDENVVTYVIVPVGVDPKFVDIFLVQSIGPVKK
jgi:translation elongation factor P/translation initiation factor 5A